MEKIYVDKITEIREIDVLDSDDLLECLKKDDENKNQSFVLEFLPQKTLEQMDFTKTDDIRKMHDLLYRCDTPLTSMLEYDSRNDVFKLIDHEGKINGCFLYRNGNLIYTTMNHVFEKKDNGNREEYFITSFNFYDILRNLIDKSIGCYVYCQDNFKLLEIDKNVLLKLIGVNEDDKNTSRVKK